MIFLTGATGHMGSRAARRLVERGRRLRCLVHTPDHRRFLPEGVEAVEGDVEDVARLAEAMRGAEACLHLAHIRYAPHAVEACRRAGVQRLICMSSTRRYTRFDCDSARAVVAGESAVEVSGLRWTILRPSMIYGGDRDNNIERLIRHFRRTRLFPLVRGGRQLVQPVFVWDVVGAIEAALERPASIGCAYTLAGPEPLTFRQMVDAAARIAGCRPLFVPVAYPLAFAGAWLAERLLRRSPLTVEQVQRFLEDKAFDLADARKDLGFDPISFETGMWRKQKGQA
ncbi:MAG: NAD(P)H-binding protein [Candidatus Sumerlaeota bacterium]|nr:NAD(P)H-binding protein [Candidatus Sumerlaeota bacterium]